MPDTNQSGSDDAAPPPGAQKPNGQPPAEDGKPSKPTLAPQSESAISFVEDSLQAGLGAQVREKGFDAASEKLLLEELKASGVDVGAYVKQLQAHLEARRRSITAFELQLTIHQAVDGWRSSTREAAVKIHKMIEDTQQSGDLLLRQAIYLEGVVKLVEARAQTFEQEVIAHLGRLGTEVGLSVESATGKLSALQAKIDAVDGSLAAKLDAHVDAASTRATALFAKCEASSEQLIASADGAAAKVEKLLQERCEATSTKLGESLDGSVRKIEAVQSALRAAEESVHTVETRAANVSRDLVQMDRSMSDTLNAFRMPIILPALVGGLVGSGGGALIAIVLWRLLAGG